LGKGVLHGEHAAPRLAEEVQLVEPERLAYGVDLVDEEVHVHMAGS
jgi:hypothetical protein